MEIRFCLAELLDNLGVPRRNMINHICRKTQLKRHKVDSLLNNTIKRVPLEVLEAICNYLVKEHKMDPRLLPGALFRLEPSNFWSLLGERDHIEISFGIRCEPNGKQRWVMACDSFLHGVLLREISGAGFQRSHELDQRLLTAPDTDVDESSKDKLEELIKGATKTLNHFDSITGSKAHVCVGSVKSNFMVESLMARLFREEPFVSKDQIKKAEERGCPIYYHYRLKDPKPPSCHGGTHLTNKRKKSKPGIWYETRGGSWTCCPCDETQDAAMVAYAFRTNTGRLDMILGGYSGRATESLAEILSGMGKQFWPPIYDKPHLRVGVYIVKFKYETTDSEQKKAGNNMFGSTLAGWNVLRLDEEVLKRKLERETTVRRTPWW